MSSAGVAATGVSVSVGTGGVPIAPRVRRPPAASTDATLACTVAGRDAHAVERIAPGPRLRLVGTFRAVRPGGLACAWGPPSPFAAAPDGRRNDIGSATAV